MHFDEILSQPEGRRLEFKRQMPKKSDILRTIIAFSNGAGGQIVLGIDDKTRQVVGLRDDILMLEERISNMVFDAVAPIVSPFFSIMNIDDSTVLVIKIPAGSQKPYFLKSKGVQDGTFVRVGSTSRKADIATIEELKRQSRNICFDSIIDYNFRAENLSLSMLRRYINASEVDLETSYETFEKIGIAIRTNSESHPKIGGVLLFAEEYPDEYLSYFVKVTRFEGKTMSDISDTREFLPPLPVQLEDTFSACKLFIRKNVIMDGLARKEEFALPVESVREALVNAICHRDYSIKGAGIQVHIFTDRLEVISPGILPGDLSIRDLGSGVSEVRNLLIVRFFRGFRYVEQLGSGIARMLEAAKERGQPPPEFQELGNFFKVTLFITPDKHDDLLDFVEQRGEIRISDVVSEFGWHRNTISRRLKALEKSGLIDKTGRGPATRYRKI